VDSDVYSAYADGMIDSATEMSAFSFWDDAVIMPVS
jgi:hypothetical protein